MRKFLIERRIPGLGAMSAEQLVEVSRQSVGVLRELSPDVQWLNSYVTEERLVCVYLASNEALVRTHAERGGFPADEVLEVTKVIDPLTAEGVLWAATPNATSAR